MAAFIKIETTNRDSAVLNTAEISSIEETRYSDRNATAIIMNDKRTYYVYKSVEAIYTEIMA